MEEQGVISAIHRFPFIRSAIKVKMSFVSTVGNSGSRSRWLTAKLDTGTLLSCTHRPQVVIFNYFELCN